MFRGIFDRSTLTRFTSRFGRVPVIGGALLGTLLVGAVAMAVSDSGDHDVEVADRTGFAAAPLDNAIVQYIGDLNTTFGSAGSGVFESFVQVQNSPTEHGYNTDGVKEFDTGSSPTFNHSIKVSEIPTVTEGSTTYWEFFADINDSDSTPLISLDKLEIYLTSNAAITGYPFGSATLVYDFDGTIRINDVNQGSGRGDLRYLIDIADITVPDNCNYGNPACSTYLVLYSAWGNSPGGYESDGGFEEWKVKKYPVLTVTKTIDGTYETPVTWTITKDGDATYDLFAGATSPIHGYTIDVTPVLGNPTNAVISGTITIDGDDDTAVTATISDVFGETPATITGCSVAPSGGTYAIPKKGTITCDYELPVGDAIAGTNVATASIEVDGVSLAYAGSADIAVADYDFDGYTGLTSVLVTDDNGTPAGPGDDNPFGPFTPASHPAVGYSRTFSCSSDPADYTAGTYSYTVVNTATINATTESDTATVTVNCYLPSVSKTVSGSFTETTDWTIDKTPDGNYSLFAGGSVDHDYTIDLDKTVTPSSYAVSGTVTVVNPHPSAALSATLTDTLSDGTPVVFSACTNGATLVGSALSVPAATTTVCSYTAGGLDGDEASNTATLTVNGIAQGDTKAIIFTGGAAGEPGTVNVTDDNGTPAGTGDDRNFGPINADSSTGYSQTFSCSTDPADYTSGTYSYTVVNTASIDETTDSDTATVTVDCYAPVVTKTALPSFSRDWTWTIDKTGDQTALTLDEGQSFVVNYDVTVDATSIDDGWTVTGTITVQNPNPDAAMTLASVTDVAGGISAPVICPGLTVPAGGTLECTYDTGVQSSPGVNPFGATNTASAVFAGSSWTGTAPITFGTTPATETDECIDVTDSEGGALGTVCAGGAPHSFRYPLTVGPYATCGTYQFENIADFVTNDNAETGSDNHIVTIDVPCPQGCTLTQGYWKTHSTNGPAPYDETWAEIGESTPFFFSAQSYYQVLWTSPTGGNAYYILAHQYIAAELNMLDGAAAPAEVQTAFAAATTWFDNTQHTPEYVASLKGKTGQVARSQLITWAGILADYNEGDLGPGHCDEDGTSVL